MFQDDLSSSNPFLPSFALPSSQNPLMPWPLCIQEQIRAAEAMLSVTQWVDLEDTAQTCFERVLEGFIQNKVGEEHFYSVTGYGHDDMGREVTGKVFAHALQAEAALVRPTFASGTHALSVGLNGCVGMNQRMVCLTGRPYDTLEEVIGIRGESKQSLKARGVDYQEVDLLSEGRLRHIWTAEEEALVQSAQLVYLQRSRGYSAKRPSLVIEELKEIIDHARFLNPDILVMVDNCYGEFTETQEPTAISADLIAGSLIKNPGGGIVPSGGYLAGRQAVIDSCADVLTCPGVANEGGYTFDLTRLILQGLFMAPGVVKEALKGMTLAAHLFEHLGYPVNPHWQAKRSDIIQMIHLKSADNLVKFCQILQKVSPINSAVTPIPAQIPGYADEVVMAGGTFIEGSTVELSADGPIRPPYTVYLQGGLNYAHTRYAIQKILETLVGQELIGQEQPQEMARNLIETSGQPKTQTQKTKTWKLTEVAASYSAPEGVKALYPENEPSEENKTLNTPNLNPPQAPLAMETQKPETAPTENALSAQALPSERNESKPAPPPFEIHPLALASGKSLFY
jgi:cystathionine beta-lyase family protein involved in aluminum resistance